MAHSSRPWCTSWTLRGRVGRVACDDRAVHEDLVRSARRRCWAIATVGLGVLTATIAIVVLPIAWILGALSTPFGTGLGYGWGLLGWAVSVSLALGGITALAVFAWSLLHAES